MRYTDLPEACFQQNTGSRTNTVVLRMGNKKTELIETNDGRVVKKTEVACMALSVSAMSTGNN